MLAAVKELYAFDDRVIEFSENKYKKEIIVQTNVFNCICSVEKGIQFITDWLGQKPIIIIDNRMILSPYEYGWCVVSHFSETRETYHSTITEAISYMKDLLLRWEMSSKKKLTKVEQDVKIAAENYLNQLLSEHGL